MPPPASKADVRPVKSFIAQQSHPKTFVSSHIWESNFQLSRIVGNRQRDSVPYRTTDRELSWLQAATLKPF